MVHGSLDTPELPMSQYPKLIPIAPRGWLKGRLLKTLNIVSDKPLLEVFFFFGGVSFRKKHLYIWPFQASPFDCCCFPLPGSPGRWSRVIWVLVSFGLCPTWYWADENVTGYAYNSGVGYVHPVFLSELFGVTFIVNRWPIQFGVGVTGVTFTVNRLPYCSLFGVTSTVEVVMLVTLTYVHTPRHAGSQTMGSANWYMIHGGSSRSSHHVRHARPVIEGPWLNQLAYHDLPSWF